MRPWRVVCAIGFLRACSATLACGPCAARFPAICESSTFSFQGDFCECNTNANSCTSQCNGNGECKCGTCVCADKWTGDLCACSTAPCEEINGLVCNNRGKCECGECICDDIASSWDARIIQDKRTCIVSPHPKGLKEQCRLLDACALCHHEENTHCSKICDPHITVNVTETLSNTNDSNICENVRYKFGCYTRYGYRYKDGEYGIELVVQTDRSCNETYYVFGGIFLLTLILTGVGTLVAWKLLTDARDRREYERFVRQHAADAAGAGASGTCVNPIYEPATTTFRNPAFRKRSVDFR